MAAHPRHSTLRLIRLAARTPFGAWVGIPILHHFPAKALATNLDVWEQGRWIRVSRLAGQKWSEILLPQFVSEVGGRIISLVLFLNV